MTLDGSVVVPTFGGADRLPELLRALGGQACDRPWEVVVVVDGVVDDTVALLEQHKDRLPLTTVVLDENRGRPAALNAGYAAATGRVVIRCDDDLTPAADFVARHLAWHDDRDDLGVIGLTRDRYPTTPYALVYGHVAGERGRAAAARTPAGARWQHWAANNSVCRATWERVGGFDPHFALGEDFELGWRLVDAGVSLVIDEHLETEHRGPAPDTRARAARAFTSGVAHRQFDDAHPRARATIGTTAPPTPKDRAWHVVVDVGARLAPSSAKAARTGRLVDVVLPWVPLRLGRALVAASVEGAARAGYAGAGGPR